MGGIPGYDQHWKRYIAQNVPYYDRYRRRNMIQKITLFDPEDTPWTLYYRFTTGDKKSHYYPAPEGYKMAWSEIKFTSGNVIFSPRMELVEILQDFGMEAEVLVPEEAPGILDDDAMDVALAQVADLDEA